MSRAVQDIFAFKRESDQKAVAKSRQSEHMSPQFSFLEDSSNGRSATTHVASWARRAASGGAAPSHGSTERKGSRSLHASTPRARSRSAFELIPQSCSGNSEGLPQQTSGTVLHDSELDRVERCDTPAVDTTCSVECSYLQVHRPKDTTLGDTPFFTMTEFLPDIVPLLPDTPLPDLVFLVNPFAVKHIPQNSICVGTANPALPRS